MKSNSNKENEQPCSTGFWIGDRAERWWRMCLWLIPVHYVNTSHLCSGKQRDKWLLWGAVHNTKLNTSQKLIPFFCKSWGNKTSRPRLVVRQGHQTEWPHLHPGGSIAAFLPAPSIFSLLYSMDFIDSISQIVLWMSLYLAWWKILPGFFWWEVLLLALFDFQQRLFLTKILQFHKFICYLINIIKCLFDKSNKNNKMPFQ